MPATLGSATVTIFDRSEMHKMHLEFEVGAAATIYKGQLVKLDTDGTLIAASAADPREEIIGVSIHDAVGADGDMCTVVVKGFVVVFAEAAAASLNAGIVQAGAFNSTTGYQEYAAAAGADDAAKQVVTVGINLTQATSDGDVIKVMLMF
jgi:hypothetical protein